MKEKLRMAEWLLISVVLLVAIWFTAPQQLGVSMYKLSLITTAAWVGYWIDRSLFPYARPDKLEYVVGGAPIIAAAQLRRAAIVCACMIASALGA